MAQEPTAVDRRKQILPVETHVTVRKNGGESAAWGFGRVPYNTRGEAGIQCFGGQFEPEPGALP
jgi:hypothetical protein